MQFYLLSSLIFALLVAVFALQNTEIVTIKFLTFQFPASLVLVILGSAIIGALALFFLGLFKQFGSWFRFRSFRQEKELLEKHIAELEEKVATFEAKKEELLNKAEEQIIVKPEESGSAVLLEQMKRS